ncbi:MAG: hypothetical protein JNK29_08020, partial [Anaerolineales bacterium]|nr:hypothetical protein [Anaerolineales bacterium]
SLETIDFAGPMKGLMDGLAARLKGFDLSDTQDYYRRIVSRAVKEAETVGDVAQREKAIDRDLEWIMMAPRRPSVFQTGGWSYRPLWVRPLIVPGGRPALSVPRPAAPSAGGKSSFGDVAAGFAGWAENTMGGLASAIGPGALQAPSAKGGFVNLSGADKVTGDIFEALAKASASSGGGRRGGGGGGRSCACACAGCACACACAGGGR